MRGAAGHRRKSPWATVRSFGRAPSLCGTRAARAARVASAATLASALAAGVALALAGAAHADDIEGLRSLNLQVYGSLEQHCALGRISDADFGDLTQPGKHAGARVDLDCNVPINVNISAAHGALAHERHPNGQGPYAGSVPYSLDVRIPVRLPARDVIRHSFESKDLLAGGQTFNTGNGIAVDGMDLSIALGPAGGDAGLLAGHYSETIEITVTPS